MAGLITVRLSRTDAQPWGFRLQGGKDFGAPLLIQKVNGGSLAEKAGLQVADAVIQVNGEEVYNLRHKDAQDAIVKAGNSFEVVISRGPGGTWKPAVTPVGNVPSPSPIRAAPSPVTKTSLAYKGPASPAIGSGHNVAAKPFATTQLNGVGEPKSVKSITSKQYNNPVGLYSEQTIAETLSAQAEVLAGGVLGVNFMKNEKAYTANNSEVLKMVQEIDNEPKDPEPVESVSSGGGVVVPPPVSGLRHVAAPETKAPSTSSPQSSLQPGQNVCADCERLVVGAPISSGVIPAPQPSTAPQSPQPSNLAPLPFHAPRMKPSHVNAPRTFKAPASTFSAPKPFGALASTPAPFSTPSAPVSATAPTTFSSVPTPPALAPFSAAPAPPSLSSFPKSLPGQITSKPLAKKGQTEPSYSSSQTDEKSREQLKDLKEIDDITNCLDKSKRMSVCSNEVCALSENKAGVKTLASVIEDIRRASPVPFTKGGIVSEVFSSIGHGAMRASENIETLEEENRHIKRKTKVEESFVKSHKTYSAEINTASQSSFQIRASSPEMEQIMAGRQVHQSYHDTSQVATNTLSIQHKLAQPERCLTPEIENLMDKPHGTWSPMPAACFVRPISPSLIISYPPDIPAIHATLPQTRTATPEQFQEARETVERFVDHTKHSQQAEKVCGKSTQSYIQQAALSSHTQQFSGQQYIPRHDISQVYDGRNPRNLENPDNHVNINTENQSNITTVNTQNPNFYDDRNPESRENQRSKDNCSKMNAGFGKKDDTGDAKWEKLEENETYNPDEKDNHKNCSGDQSQKASRKASVTEEESSRRVFSDFGGPQVSSSVEVESVTEGGIKKTSVKKSEKTEYSSCEFESSRKSSVIKDHEDNKMSESNYENKTNSTSSESMKDSSLKFSAGESSHNKEEMVTKSEVEQIIKQELNKVFQMAQAMETTNFGELYDHKSQKATSEQCSKQNFEQNIDQVVDQSSNQKVEQKLTSSQYINKTCTGTAVTQTGKLTSGLTIAPDRPFTPQALESNYPLPYQNVPSDFPPPRIQPVISSSKPPYISLTGDRSSPLLQALTIASDRPYSPLPSSTDIDTPTSLTLPKPKKSSMLDALTTAPSTPFHIEGISSEITVGVSNRIGKKSTETNHESANSYATKPAQSGFKPISIDTIENMPPTSYIYTSQTSESCNLKSFPPVSDELKSAFKSTSKLKSSSFMETERQQIEVSKQTSKSSNEKSSSSIIERPITPSGLHPPNLLPYYQQNIGEIPLAHRSNSPVPHQIKAPMITPPRAQSVPQQSDRQRSVKAMSEAYTQQLSVLKNSQQQQPVSTKSQNTSVSYVSAGVYSSGSVNKTYSYEKEHKSIDEMGYHASPLAGKLPLAGEQTLPKCSSPVLGKLDHTKQVFKPSISTQQPVSAFRSPVAEQANLRQTPPYFVQGKEKPQAPWTVVKEKDELETRNFSSFKLPQPSSQTCSIPQLNSKPSLPSIPSVNNTLPAFPEPPKPFSFPGVTKPPSSNPDAGPGSIPKSGTTAGTSAPRRGRGVLNTAVSGGGRIPLCASCNSHIRGPFITALGQIWCPEHFVCVNAQCRRPLQDIGFVEDAQGLYCEFCFEQYLAPTCNKCNAKVKGDCLNAIGKHFHPECFTCAYCGKLFGNSPFFLEDALPYCETDWNELFTTKCFSCGFPIEAGDRWVEALNNNYHSQCFNCNMCKKNLEGQSFFAKGGRPFCKNHAR